MAAGLGDRAGERRPSWFNSGRPIEGLVAPVRLLGSLIVGGSYSQADLGAEGPFLVQDAF